MARLLKSHWRRSSFRPQLEEYSRLTLLELGSTARLVGALYATMDRFDLFRELSLLYFAAASFSESARRLGKFHLADSFILCRHPVFAARCRQLCDLAARAVTAGDIADVRCGIREAIEPFDVAGLTDDSRHPWYPALASDVLRGAPKLDAGETEVTAMLRKCGINCESPG